MTPFSLVLAASLFFCVSASSNANALADEESREVGWMVDFSYEGQEVAVSRYTLTSPALIPSGFWFSGLRLTGFYGSKNLKDVSKDQSKYETVTNDEGGFGVSLLRKLDHERIYLSSRVTFGFANYKTQSDENEDAPSRNYHFIQLNEGLMLYGFDTSNPKITANPFVELGIGLRRNLIKNNQLYQGQTKLPDFLVFPYLGLGASF